MDNRYMKYKINTNYPTVCHLSEISDLEKEINETKNKLDKYQKDGRYTYFSRQIIPQNGLKAIIESKFMQKYVTNAWLKTFELLSEVQEYMPLSGDYKVFFNANAPGASTLAAEYFFKIRTNLNFDWFASSYMDGSGTLQDDYGLIKNNRDKWLMNEENNGDVRSVANLENLCKRLGSNSIDLYFSDIAIDIGNDYNNEEYLERHEVFGQNVTGLCLLKKGGIMITKQRSFYKPFSIWMISFMSKLFDKFEIHKPTTSRPYNSEVYLVGIGYKGMSIVQRDYMVGLLGKDDIHTVVCNNSIFRACYELTKRQKDSIDNCIELYKKHKKNIDGYKRSIYGNHKMINLMFINKYLR